MISMCNGTYLGESVHTHTHRELVDAERRDGGSVAPELGDEGEFVQVPDDAGAVPRPA